MIPRTSPVESCRFVSGDPVEVTAFIRDMYVGNRCTFDPPRDRRPRYDARAARTPEVSSSLVRSTITYAVETEPHESYLFFAVRGGRLTMRCADQDVDLGRGQVALCPPGATVDAVAHAVDEHLVQLPADRLTEVAEEATGVPPGQLAFHAITPVTPAMGVYWRSVMGLLGGALAAPDSPMSFPLLAREMIRAAAVAAVHVFPNTSMTREHVPGPGGVGPATMRRAVAFIEANADRPVTVSEVAAAAGTGSRALQYAFRRHHGTSPLGYLRRVRLEHAHRDLQDADPTRGDTVAGIAARWGFAKPDRFSAYYRDAYGSLPSQTLRR